MEKTLTINISGFVFHIDEEAYEKLKSYLDKVGTHFSRVKDGREIFNGIELRIAELFTGMVSTEKKVVDIAMVDRAIETTGMPENFVDITNEKPEEESTTTMNQSYNYRRSKKLYRDPDSRIVGGLCSGFAHYLNMDKVLARVLFVILIFVSSGVALPVYLILWIVVPKAKTVSQRREMMGETLTVEDIGK
jgi:phage shock protein PspC (stress-responsive transcriptional regulator)